MSNPDNQQRHCLVSPEQTTVLLVLSMTNIERMRHNLSLGDPLEDKHSVAFYIQRMHDFGSHEVTVEMERYAAISYNCKRPQYQLFEVLVAHS